MCSGAGVKRDRLEAALEYLAHGWALTPIQGMLGGSCGCGNPSCRYSAKHPNFRILREVHGASSPTLFRQRRATEDDVRAWFGVDPHTNIALVTGPISGVVVADCDHGVPDARLRARGRGALRVAAGHPGDPGKGGMGGVPGHRCRCRHARRA